MSFKSKRTITSTVAGILLFAGYAVYALGKNAVGPQSLKFWATAMLVFVGISVAAMIVLQILFHIAAAIGIAGKESLGRGLAGAGEKIDGKQVERLVSATMKEDEMDKLISRKSAHVGEACSGFGFLAALAAIAFGASAALALHIQFAAIALGAVAEGCVSVYFYERGVRHG
ncbi:hypothetical protein FACS1894196_0750 [Clostridia bacterium]|nr:hypothetical protein FACS1894196_0750 [Clostridia bacterium]